MAEENRPWEKDPDGGSFGSWLRRQREVREITLREIAQESKISLRYLEAIEQDRDDVLPAQVFVRGFLREYARFVGLDPDEVVNFHMASRSNEEDVEDEASPRISERQSGVRPIWLLAALALVLVVIAGFSYLTRSREGRPNTLVPPQSAPAPQPPVAEREVMQQSPIRLAMDFTQTSWVSVTVDGERAVSELRVQGESLRVEAQRELRVTLGNVDGVSFELNGEPFPIGVGDDEELVIDLEDLAVAEPPASGAASPSGGP